MNTTELDKLTLIATGTQADLFSNDNNRAYKVYRSSVCLSTINYEYTATIKARQLGISVPKVDNIIKIGKRYAMPIEKLSGQTALELVKHQPIEGRHLGKLIAKTHIDIHKSVGSAQKANGILPQQERLASRIKQATSFTSEIRSKMLRLLDSLPNGDILCHNDLHPGNIMLCGSQTVVIDWADTDVGNPIADVARTIILLTTGQSNNGNFFKQLSQKLLQNIACNQYLHHYKKHRNIDKIELKSWLAIIAFVRTLEYSNDIRHLEPFYNHVITE